MKKFLIILLCIILIGAGAFFVWKSQNKQQETSGTITPPVAMISIADLKTANTYSSLSTNDVFASNYTFKPFYNVEQITEFTFHFKSVVDPVKAITVHTDSKCEENSTVYQLNDGYITADGCDVVVKPGTPVLSSSDRKDSDSNKKWGYAPIYYLCIRYDLDATTPTKLESPIVIPFTIKNEIDTPNVIASIDKKGNFFVEWNAVEDATGYKIYTSNAISSSEFTRAECGFVGDFLKLLVTVDNKTLQFKDIDINSNSLSHNENNLYIDSNGYVRTQNNMSLPNIYITAIDDNGNESSFSKVISAWKYDDILPYDVSLENLGVKNGTIEKFLDSVQVKTKDQKVAVAYPINYYKIKEQTGNHKCDYRYEIVGTELTGEVTYYSETDTFPTEVISKIQARTFAIEPDINIDIIPSRKVNSFSNTEYSNVYIDLKNNINYSDEAKIKLDPATLLDRADRESARIIKKGIYASSLDTITSYVAADTPEYILEKKADGTIIVKKNPNKTTTSVDSEIIEEIKPQKTEDGKLEITSANYVDLQRLATQKQVEEANKITIKNTNYPVFAESAEQKYLALQLINHEKEISLKAFPALQNAEYLLDSLLYVYYQNPYILGLDINKTYYYPNTQTVVVNYYIDDATIEKQQKEILEKATSVINSIIKLNMTKQDKVIAIWDYLESNSRYENEVLEYAAAHNYIIDNFEGFENTFNTYGILCKGIGVCQSYAYTFKLLCYMCDINCVMVTGALNNVGHAWNAVEIDGEWYMIDSTNNINAVGIPYWIFQSSSDFIKKANFAMDGNFVVGENYSAFLNSKKEQDYYYLKELMPADTKECGKLLAKMWLKDSGSSGSYIVKLNLTQQSELIAVQDALIAEFKKNGRSVNELSNWQLVSNVGMTALIQY